MWAPKFEKPRIVKSTPEVVAPLFGGMLRVSNAEVVTMTEAAMITNQDSMEVVYLDLDGDGVPDAVQTRQLRSRDVKGDRCTDVIVTTTTIESGIGIDGVAASVETRSETFVHGGLRRSA